MATTTDVKQVTLPAGENLKGDALETLKLNAAGQVVKTDDATDSVVGILFMDPDTTKAGDAVPVMLIGGGGIGKVKVANGVAAGDILVPTATAGRADGVTGGVAALAADQSGFGIALEASTSDNQIIEFLAQVIAAPHTA